jgi:predicted acetyltransferase
MITYADVSHLAELKALWQICFPSDPDEFIEPFFDFFFNTDEILVDLEDNRPVAALQMTPYPIQTPNAARRGCYLSGVMTHPDFRMQGRMGRLLNASTEEMRNEGFDYAFLIPQDNDLAAMYAKYGYRLLDVNPDPPINRVVKSPEQWASYQEIFYNEYELWLDHEPTLLHEHKGMIQRINPDVEELTTLYLGMMFD